MTAKPLRAMGYARVSTDEQGRSGLGLDAQCSTIRGECERRGWTVAEIAHDIGSGGSMAKRPELARLLAMLDSGEADVLVVSRLDRLSRSVRDAANVLERARAKGWALLAADVAVDTSTPSGELTANVILSAAQYERRLIGARTSEALQAAKARGVQLGRPSGLTQATVARIIAERLQGKTYRAIAASLDADGVPTSHGARSWCPTTVRKVWLRACKDTESRESAA